MDSNALINIHRCLILLDTKVSVLQCDSEETKLDELTTRLINGQYAKVIESDVFANQVFQNQKIQNLVTKFISNERCDQADLYTLITGITQLIISNISDINLDASIQQTYCLSLAVLFLQIFVQLNFTGPTLPLLSLKDKLGFIGTLSSKITSDEKYAAQFQRNMLKLLSIEGQQPYNLVDSPLFLALACNILETLQGVQVSLLSPEAAQMNSEEFVQLSCSTSNIISSDCILLASISWWRERALQILQSLYSDYSASLTVICYSLLSKERILPIIDGIGASSIGQALLLTRQLELAKCSLAGNSELKTMESLSRAGDISGIELVLTGCKAKRTKYQHKSIAALTVLAKSKESLLRLQTNDSNLSPQDVKLNDDTFLEKPVFDELGDDEIFKQKGETLKYDDLNDIKRIKIDYTDFSDESSVDFSRKLLPTAKHKADIPNDLNALDPNAQPALAGLDYAQLLSRMEAIKKNTPKGNALVDEELIALVQRVLFSPECSVNWLLFSRALWYRSLLEASKRATVERGVLQLYSLVEELGITSDKTARLFPKSDDDVCFPQEFLNTSIDSRKVLANSIRLRYVYVISAMPKWEMDLQLAHKLTELGLFKSALEIYERLRQWPDAAVCYETTGDKVNARSVIEKAVAEDPDNARAWCILGDVTTNPQYWEKSWELGHYANAKSSLAKYYYKPPKDSGIERDVKKAIDNMYDCLCSNPINFDNWYFYGCMGLEVSNYELASEAFHRALNIDDSSPYAWSNLASALIKLEKFPEAFQALSKAINAGDATKKSWRIWENFLTIAIKLGKWSDVLRASIILLNSDKTSLGSSKLDIPVMEKLIGVLTRDPYDPESLTFFQNSCIDFVCNKVPSVVNNDVRCWKDIAKVNQWRRKPWLVLDNYEKAYRASVNSPKLTLEEDSWNVAVDTCADLIKAYQDLGELPGRFGADDLVCKNWKFKAKSSIRSLISKGKRMWEYTDGYERLQKMKREL